MHPGYLALTFSAVLAAPSAATPHDLNSLRAELVKEANSLWNSHGWSLDPDHAWVTLAAPLPEAAEMVIRPLFSASPEAPRMPLQFEIAANGAAAPVRVSLAAAVLHEEWVARKRLIRGTPVSSADFSHQFLRWQGEGGSLPRVCALAEGSVALRELSAGDRVQPTDLGAAPAVMANSAVTVTVALNGVEVSTTGTALSDANDGESLSVRLQNPLRVVQVRVVGSGQTIVASAP
jgi:flagella basal body P-ring formation protein FlgA